MNFSTITVLCILIMIICLVIRSMMRDKELGKSSCGGNCGACGSQSLCHNSQNLVDLYKKQELHR